MVEYAVTFARSARKELESLSGGPIDRIVPRIESLSRIPGSPGCRKLAGKHNLWCSRIGDYRVIYSIDDSQRIIDIVDVRNRKDAYR